MTTRLPRKDVAIVGLGWTGSIMALELARAGLSVVAVERGPWRDTATDFNIGTAPDESASPRLCTAEISMADDAGWEDGGFVPTEPDASPATARTPMTRKLVVDSPVPGTTITGLMSTNWLE